MCDSMPGTFHNLLLQHCSVTGDNEHGCFLIFSVKCVDRLCGNELENDGIHRSLKSKQKTCGRKYHHIDTKNKIPGRFMQSGGKINRNKIRSTAGSFSEQSNRDCCSVQNPAKYRHQKRIICNRRYRDQIDQKRVQYDHQYRI